MSFNDQRLNNKWQLLQILSQVENVCAFQKEQFRRTLEREENFDIWLKCFKSADEVDLYRACQTRFK